MVKLPITMSMLISNNMLQAQLSVDEVHFLEVLTIIYMLILELNIGIVIYVQSIIFAMHVSIGFIHSFYSVEYYIEMVL